MADIGAVISIARENRRIARRTIGRARCGREAFLRRVVERIEAARGVRLNGPISLRADDIETRGRFTAVRVYSDVTLVYNTGP